MVRELILLKDFYFITKPKIIISLLYGALSYFFGWLQTGFLSRIYMYDEGWDKFIFMYLPTSPMDVKMKYFLCATAF